jgi:mono/diheme cytochrome c family protein
MRRVIVTIALGASMGGAVVLAQGGARTVKDGVYSEQQAARGKELYTKNCASCHQPDLSGKAISDNSGAPALKGETFVANWADINVDDFLTRIKTTMPYDNPDSLMRDQYVEIIAYLLQTNEFPAGQKELPVEAEGLKTITITKK